MKKKENENVTIHPDSHFKIKKQMTLIIKKEKKTLNHPFHHLTSHITQYLTATHEAVVQLLARHFIPA